MKKLLAILLTLAMLVPMCGFAEESAPGATRTVIFLKDFNAKVLGADIDEAEEKAVNDFLDALRVIVYQQGTTSAAYEVTLNDQPIVDYAVQFSGADVYVSSDLLGETLYLNLDEDMQHFGELVYRQQLSHQRDGILWVLRGADCAGGTDGRNDGEGTQKSPLHGKRAGGRSAE